MSTLAALTKILIKFEAFDVLRHMVLPCTTLPLVLNEQPYSHSKAFFLLSSLPLLCAGFDEAKSSINIIVVLWLFFHSRMKNNTFEYTRST